MTYAEGVSVIGGEAGVASAGGVEAGASRARVVLVALAAAVAGVVLLRLVADARGLSVPGSADVFWLRGMRAATGLVVGAALGVSGALLQALVRNPLASPDLLGLSAGASLAVVVSTAAAAGVGGIAGGAGGAAAGGVALAGWQAVPAMVGAVSALGVVWGLSQRRGLVDPLALVLVGVVISVLAGSAIVLVQTLWPGASVGPAGMLLGGLSDETPRGAVVVGGVLTVGVTCLAARWGATLDAASLSDDEAASVGVHLPTVRAGLLLGSGALAACAVVLAGPVAFVGLIAPHAVRALLGPGHRGVVAGSALAGAGLIVLADAAARVVTLRTGQLPLGVVTALVGGPVFLWMLRGRGR